jgi:hypothetical protein
MRTPFIASIVTVIVLAAPRVRAQSLVLESHTGQRRADADHLMAPIIDELGDRKYVVGAKASKLIESNISRSGNPDNIALADLSVKVDNGYRSWMQGDFAAATDALQAVIEQVTNNPAAIALNQEKRSIVSKALIGLSLSQLRQGDTARAEATMADLIRAFPDVVLSRGQFGPEASNDDPAHPGLYQRVRQQLDAAGRGILAVTVDDPSVVVFLDEHFEAVGKMKKGDLLAGEYRVYTLRASQGGRAYKVTVKPRQETTLAIDWTFDSSLVTTPTYAGFVFAREEDRKAHEHEFAVRVARETSAPGVLVIGIDEVDGRQAIVGSVLSLETGEPLRTGAVFLEPAEPSEKRLRAFARFLAGEDATEGIDKVKISEPRQGTVIARRESAGVAREANHGTRGPWKWIAAGGAIAAIGAGAVLVEMNGRCTADPLPGDTLCQRVYDTRTSGIATMGAGVALGALAGYLFFAHHAEEQPAAAIVPTSGGAVFTWSREF